MKRKKYALGTPLNYMTSPAEELNQDHINKTKAEYEAQSNPLLMGMEFLGTTLMTQGLKGAGIDPAMGVGIDQIAKQFAMGGTTGPGGKEKLTDADNKSINESTGIEFTNEGMNSLFTLMDKTEGNPLSDLDLGKYKDVGYFDVTTNGDKYIINTTAKNPYNYDAYKNALDEIQELNPNALIDRKKGYNFAMGGAASGDIEAEGEEVVETPDGNTKELKGPKHEQGGIKMNVPDGTKIFSDRILVEGKTMADRKKARLARIKKLESQLAKNPMDKATKNTYERTLASLNNEEEKDLKTQELISNLVGTQGEAMFGLNSNPGFFDMLSSIFSKDKSHQGTNPNIDYDAIDKDFSNLNVDDIDASTNGATKINQSSTSEGGFMDTLSKMFAPGEGNPTNTTGNALGIAGNLFSGIAPLLNTLQNRATDTPNTNEFKEFGKDALEANSQAQGYVEGVKSNALKDIDRNNLGAKRRARTSSRSVNTQRATDLVSDQTANQANEGIQDNFATQMMQLLTQRSGLENQQDQVVMQGEQQRDLADRQDKDNFYSNKSQNLATLGQAVQQTGKDLNQSEQQKIMMNILNQMSKYGITFDKDFKMQNPE